MSERDEMREAVRAEYGVTVSSKLVDGRMKAAYDSLGEMPRVKKSGGKRVLKWAGGVAGGVAAAFLVLVGISTVNPALAAGIPGMESIVAFFRGGGRSMDPVITKGDLKEYVQPVTDAREQELQITETYYDGKTLVLGVSLTLPDAPEGYRVLRPNYRFSFASQGEELTPPWESEKHYWDMSRISEDTYAGTVTMDLADAVLPEEFELTIGVKALTAVDTKLMVKNNAGQYSEKTYSVEPDFAPFSCTVQKQEDLRKVYEVNETQNGCTLKSIVVTPALTEVNIACEETGVAMLPYGDDGKKLEGMSKYGGRSYEQQYFRVLPQDAEQVVVKFFRKENKHDPIAEFTVPVEGGYAEEPVETVWSGDDIPVVFDPPLPEEADADERDGVTVELGETFTVGGGIVGMQSGNVSLTFHNLRYYKNWRDAGIEERNMNLSAWGDSENQIFVLLDLTFETHDAIPSMNGEPEPMPNSAFSEDGTYWISSFVYPCSVESRPELGSILDGEIEYFSEHGNGFSDYYHFQMNANETKTVQIGFVVPVGHLEAGNFQLICESDDLHGSELRENGPYVSSGYSLVIPPYEP